ncbi:MAG: FAD-binding oxidoreductase [Rhodospirillaceae bacterium]|nr:FAD-binding oxidoreductase [Rhodospirillaceae bacterium]
MNVAKQKIIVVGVGIVGASIAYHLARAGAAVTVLEQNCPASGVTGKSFAWINLSQGVNAENAPLRAQALADYRRLQGELGDALKIDWCGALTWSNEPGESEALVRDHAARGSDIRLVTRDEIATLEPYLIAPPDCAAFAPSEGALDPVIATDALIRAAREAGAAISLTTPVIALATDSARVTGVVTRGGTIDADRVVLAAGLGTVPLCAAIGITPAIDTSPALLLRFRAAQALLRRIVSTPAFEIRQPAATTILAAGDYIDDSPANGPQAVAQRALMAIRSALRGGEAVALEDVTAGLRPMPADGLPIVGGVASVPGLYLAVMHAGIVLAPTVGRIVAGEIVGGRDDATLAHCRPDRFAPAPVR